MYVKDKNEEKYWYLIRKDEKRGLGFYWIVKQHTRYP